MYHLISCSVIQQSLSSIHSKFQTFPSGEVIQEFRRWQKGLRHNSLITVDVSIYLHASFYREGWGWKKVLLSIRIPFLCKHYSIFQEEGGDAWDENPEIKQSTAEQIVSLKSIILKI